MTTAQVVETSVTNNSLSKDYLHPDDHDKPISVTVYYIITVTDFINRLYDLYYYNISYKIQNIILCIQTQRNSTVTSVSGLFHVTTVVSGDLTCSHIVY